MAWWPIASNAQLIKLWMPNSSETVAIIVERSEVLRDAHARGKAKFSFRQTP